MWSVADGTGQGVIDNQVRFMEPTLSIAEVHGSVARASTRRFIPYTPKYRHTRGLESGVKRTEKAAGKTGSRYGGDVVWSDWDVGIKVNCLVLVQAEYVNVFGLDNRLAVDHPGVATVPLLGYRGTVVGVHQAARGARVQGARWRRDRRHRVAYMPVAECNPRARNNIARTGADRECRLEDSGVCLLLHEQRDILEGVVVVHAE